MVSPASAFHITVIIEVGVIVLMWGLPVVIPVSALHLTVITEVGIAVLMWGTQAVVSPVSA